MATKKTKEVTMADLLASAKSKIVKLTPRQRIKGIVVAKDDKSLILDIGAKSEGIVAEKAFAEARDLISKLKVGDSVMATVLFPETRDGSILLTLRDALYKASWGVVEKAFKEKTDVAVLAKGVSTAGVTIETNGLSGFVPSSQLGKELAKNKEGLVGKYFKAKVIEVDRSKNKLVLSEREVSDAEDIKLSKKALKSISEGDKFEGVVSTVANFGCFVAIEVKSAKLEGLVHVSELSWSKVGHPSDVVSVGDKVKVSVVGTKNGKLALSMKQASKDPWLEVSKKYKKEDKVEGKVTKITDFGTFVEIESGIEGLIHMTKIPPGKKFEVEEQINCYIEEVDTKLKKISLGLVLTSIPVGYK